MLVVVPVALVGALCTFVAGSIAADDGAHPSTAAGVTVLVLLGWSPALAGAITWWLLRRRGHDRRGAWGGSIAVTAIAFCAVPALLFVLYLLAWAVGSAFFY